MKLRLLIAVYLPIKLISAEKILVKKYSIITCVKAKMEVKEQCFLF